LREIAHVVGDLFEEIEIHDAKRATYLLHKAAVACWAKSALEIAGV
jgi:hypothetical protein